MLMNLKQNIKSNQYELITQSPKHCTSAFFYLESKSSNTPGEKRHIASSGIAHRMHTFYCQFVVNNIVMF